MDQQKVRDITDTLSDVVAGAVECALEMGEGAVDIAGDILEGVGELLGSLFD